MGVGFLGSSKLAGNPFDINSVSSRSSAFELSPKPIFVLPQSSFGGFDDSNNGDGFSKPSNDPSENTPLYQRPKTQTCAICRLPLNFESTRLEDVFRDNGQDGTPALQQYQTVAFHKLLA